MARQMKHQLLFYAMIVHHNSLFRLISQQQPLKLAICSKVMIFFPYLRDFRCQTIIFRADKHYHQNTGSKKNRIPLLRKNNNQFQLNLQDDSFCSECPALIEYLNFIYFVTEMAEAGNTYQLEPEKDEIFLPSRVRDIIETTLTQKLKNVTYDPSNSAQLTEEVTRIIRSRTRELKMPRYKIGVQVILGELKGQGLRLASKSLWDPEFDNWASYTYTNQNLFCTGIVFGVYFE